MSLAGRWREIGREAFLVLSAMAMALMLLVPPGFMVGSGDEGPARIAICTGHGAVSGLADLGHAPKGKVSPTCAFAGHGAPPIPGPAGPLLTLVWAPSVAPVATPADQVAIGAGLAAPPPARAPPSSRE
ncbi:MAG TPA: hypothetical protein VGH15_05130 [Caulobacteraceae bacterium]|jgi:hypothetical protein